jgi:Flp pilus assembly protein TadG
MMASVRSERGQGLVELALLLPILIVVVMGVLDFGRVYFAYVTITNAAREGAFFASLNPTVSDASVQAIVDAEISGQLDGGARVIDVSDSRSPGSQLTVTVQHDFQAITTSVLGRRTFPVRATAAMVVQ